MSRPHTAVVILAGAGARALVRACDAAAALAEQPDEIIVAAADGTTSPGIVRSLETRLGVVVESGPGMADAANAAVRRCGAALVAVVRPGFEPHRDFLIRCAADLDAHAADLAAPAVRIHSSDGLRVRIWRETDTSLAGVLGNPRAVPPAFVMARDLWQRAGGLDPAICAAQGSAAFGDVLFWDLWIRLRQHARGFVPLPEPLIALDAGNDRAWPRFQASPDYLSAYRTVLEKHRALVDREMAALLIEKEIFFGAVRSEHEEVVRRRDEILGEIDRLRAAAAHHHAYLAHHRRDGLDWGDFRRTSPVSRDWGYDRGGPVDRYYIEAFLAAHSSDIRGDVLEVQEDDLSRAFGGPRVASITVIDLDDRNPRAGIIGDLRAAPHIADASFDCVILTQTLHVIDDVRAVLRECLRILRPDGVLLATFPAASRVCLEYGEDGDYWRMTPAGARALVEPVFGAGDVRCWTSGNVLTNTAFLHGIGAGEIDPAEYDVVDPYYPALAGIRAEKPAAAASGRRAARHSELAVLLYHRVADDQDVHGLTILPEVFAQHLESLAAKCEIVPLERLLAARPGELPARSVALTFDDGYVDNLEIAAPLLQRYRVAATICATTRWLDEPGEYWWDVLERAMLDGATPPEFRFTFNGQAVALPTRDADERRAAHDRLHGALVHAPLAERERLTGDIVRWSGVGRGPRRPMTGAELREISTRPGISVAAHSVNHLSLPDQDQGVQRSEFSGSRAALQTLLGRPIDVFAYPYGAVDRQVAAVARREFRWALSCEAGARGPVFDAARAPRLDVKPWGAAELWQRIESLFAAGAC